MCTDFILQWIICMAMYTYQTGLSWDPPWASGSCPYTAKFIQRVKMRNLKTSIFD